jgi:hypothetical protein
VASILRNDTASLQRTALKSTISVFYRPQEKAGEPQRWKI